MVESTAADFYGFDLEQLRPVGDRIGPAVADVEYAAGPGRLADRLHLQCLRPDADAAGLVVRLAIRAWRVAPGRRAGSFSPAAGRRAVCPA